MSRYVEVSKVEEMLRLIRVSLIVGAGYDIREWLDYVEHMPTVDAVPVAWIEDEIRSLMMLGNPFATNMSMQLSGMLNRWKERDGNEIHRGI